MSKTSIPDPISAEFFLRGFWKERFLSGGYGRFVSTGLILSYVVFLFWVLLAPERIYRKTDAGWESYPALYEDSEPIIIETTTTLEFLDRSGLRFVLRNAEWHEEVRPGSVAPLQIVVGSGPEILGLDSSGIFYRYSNRDWQKAFALPPSVSPGLIALHDNVLVLYTFDKCWLHRDGEWIEIPLPKEFDGRKKSLIGSASGFYLSTTAGIWRLRDDEWREIENIPNGSHGTLPGKHSAQYIGEHLSHAYFLYGTDVYELSSASVVAERITSPENLIESIKVRSYRDLRPQLVTAKGVVRYDGNSWSLVSSFPQEIPREFLVGLNLQLLHGEDGKLYLTGEPDRYFFALPGMPNIGIGSSTLALLSIALPGLVVLIRFRRSRRVPPELLERLRVYRGIQFAGDSIIANELTDSQRQPIVKAINGLLTKAAYSFAWPSIVVIAGWLAFHITDIARYFGFSVQIPSGVGLLILFLPYAIYRYWRMLPEIRAVRAGNYEILLGSSLAPNYKVSGTLLVHYLVAAGRSSELLSLIRVSLAGRTAGFFRSFSRIDEFITNIDDILRYYAMCLAMEGKTKESVSVLLDSLPYLKGTGWVDTPFMLGMSKLESGVSDLASSISLLEAAEQNGKAITKQLVVISLGRIQAALSWAYAFDGLLEKSVAAEKRALKNLDFRKRNSELAASYVLLARAAIVRKDGELSRKYIAKSISLDPSGVAGKAARLLETGLIS